MKEITKHNIFNVHNDSIISTE